MDEAAQNGVGEVRVEVLDGLVRPFQLHAADNIDVGRRDAGHDYNEDEKVLRVGHDFDAALADDAVVYTDTLLTQPVEDVVGNGDHWRLHRLRREFRSADLQRKLGVFLTI